MKKVFIVGGTSGFGLSLAKEFDQDYHWSRLREPSQCKANQMNFYANASLRSRSFRFRRRPEPFSIRRRRPYFSAENLTH